MTKKIYCVFLQHQAEKLSFPPYAGKLGKLIFDNISKEAWNEWQNQQTILINEKKLSMINMNHRKFLEKAMISFLFKNKKLK